MVRRYCLPGVGIEFAGLVLSLGGLGVIMSVRFVFVLRALWLGLGCRGRGLGLSRFRLSREGGGFLGLRIGRGRGVI